MVFVLSVEVWCLNIRAYYDDKKLYKATTNLCGKECASKTLPGLLQHLPKMTMVSFTYCCRFADGCSTSITKVTLISVSRSSLFGSLSSSTNVLTWLNRLKIPIHFFVLFYCRTVLFRRKIRKEENFFQLWIVFHMMPGLIFIRKMKSKEKERKKEIVRLIINFTPIIMRSFHGTFY